MSSDALDLFRATRPQGPPTPSGDIRAPSSNRSRELHGLAMVPGQPGYNERIPRPPCFRCGEDHWATQSYDHAWEAEPNPVHDEPVSASPSFRSREAIEAVIDNRVAVYVGRGDTYIVAIESPPEWDTIETIRATDDMLLQLVRMARAMGAKVYDKTGGDLLMLEQEEAERAGQHAQDHGRGPAWDGSDSPRRPGPGTAGSPEGVPNGVEPTPASLPGRSGKRG